MQRADTRTPDGSLLHIMIPSHTVLHKVPSHTADSAACMHARYLGSNQKGVAASIVCAIIASCSSCQLCKATTAVSTVSSTVSTIGAAAILLSVELTVQTAVDASNNHTRGAGYLTRMLKEAVQPNGVAVLGIRIDDWVSYPQSVGVLDS
jgi:hypothetical protein